MASKSAFYKLLDDDLRQTILVSIHEHGSLSYSDLIEKFDMVSEKLLNYHLQVLDDFLSKNPEDQYVLTEKGRLALKFLEEFPMQETRRQKERKQFWLMLCIATSGLFVYNFLWYLRDVDFTDFLLRTVVFICLILALSYCMYLANPLLSGSERKNFSGLYLVFGGIGGFVIGFFGLILVSVLFSLTGGSSLLPVIAPDSVHLLSYLGSTAIIGGIVGYVIGKKRDFRIPSRANN